MKLTIGTVFRNNFYVVINDYNIFFIENVKGEFNGQVRDILYIDLEKTRTIPLLMSIIALYK